MLLAIIWFVVDAHKWFKGPKVNIEHMMIGQAENVLEGKIGNGSDSGSAEGEGLTATKKDDGKIASVA